ncbi:MAG: LysR family transcriptional regulator [Alphaproteobacteria bacterium]|nr:LysR family transcriptional regulator [Alphaproteobacteria bacterium]
MNIKSTLNLIRGIFYVQEIIRCHSISRTAEDNNIKPSNLSIILNDLEKQLNVVLFKRSPNGCTPTLYGRQIADYGSAIENILQKIRLWEKDLPSSAQCLTIYLAPHMELEGYWEFELKHQNIHLHFVEDETLADIKILNQAPKNCYKHYTELHLGKNLKQKIWICCDDKNPSAMAFFDFITAKLLLLYDQ